jgi:DNA helicase-2/ATP-dependent DNA helicase PcrA
MQEFNPEQKAAISHSNGPMLVLAGPGSGKTTVIIHRVKRLIEKEHVNPREILVITFTKAAAQQMKRRFLDLGVAEGERVKFGTFHSIFFLILRSAYGYDVEQIIQEEEKWNALKAILQDLDIETNDQEEYIRSFLAEVSLMKNELISIKQYEPKHLPKEEFQKVYQKMELYKNRHNKLDFDDMLVQCYELLLEDENLRKYWQEKYQHILVDEFQDINKAQYECLRLLVKEQENLFVVGDDDQSIYCFRGARPDFMLDFSKDFPQTKKVILHTNYRSAEKIIRLAEKIIRTNQKRFPKHMKGIGYEGQKIRFFTQKDATSEAEAIAKKIELLRAEGIAFPQVAIIYRTNLQGSLYARILQRKGIPYTMKDKAINIYRHWIAQDIIAYLILARNEEDDEAVKRIINKPTRYISKEFIQEASKMPYPLLRSFFCCSSMVSWQEDTLTKLQMDICKLRQMKAHEGIIFIRKVIGYDRYLADYCAYRKASLAGLLEIADEITEAAKQTETIEEFIDMMQKMGDMEESREKRNEYHNINGVVLTTMHSAKGLEFDAVFLPSLIEGVVPHEKSDTPQGIEEERRLFYVAATRARQRLYLSEIKTRYDNPATRSRFLRELGLK